MFLAFLRSVGWNNELTDAAEEQQNHWQPLSCPHAENFEPSFHVGIELGILDIVRGHVGVADFRGLEKVL